MGAKVGLTETDGTSYKDNCEKGNWKAYGTDPESVKTVRDVARGASLSEARDPNPDPTPVPPTPEPPVPPFVGDKFDHFTCTPETFWKRAMFISDDNADSYFIDSDRWMARRLKYTIIALVALALLIALILVVVFCVIRRNKAKKAAAGKYSAVKGRNSDYDSLSEYSSDEEK